LSLLADIPFFSVGFCPIANQGAFVNARHVVPLMLALRRSTRTKPINTYG
jgi:hypothetical protein